MSRTNFIDSPQGVIANLKSIQSFFSHKKMACKYHKEEFELREKNIANLMHHLPSSDHHHHRLDHNQDRYKNSELVMIDRFLWPQILLKESSSAVVKCTRNKKHKKYNKKQSKNIADIFPRREAFASSLANEWVKNINQILRVRLDCIREIIAEDRENKLLISPTMKVPINLSTSLKTFCLSLSLAHSECSRDNHKTFDHIWTLRGRVMKFDRI